MSEPSDRSWSVRAPSAGPLKAIETRYKGYRFRSRLEARWAVFFEALGLQWDYEVQGYDLDGTWYLPDFRLPQVDLFVETKSDDWFPGADPKPGLLAKAGCRVLVLCGRPWPWEYTAWFSLPGRGGLWPVPTMQFGYCEDCRRPCLLVSSNNSEVRLATTQLVSGVCHGHRVNWGRPGDPKLSASKALNDAYTAARSARFEHGETPR